MQSRFLEQKAKMIFDSVPWTAKSRSDGLGSRCLRILTAGKPSILAGCLELLRMKGLIVLGVAMLVNFNAHPVYSRDSSPMMHILVFGDSLSEGLFLKSSEVWPAL